MNVLTELPVALVTQVGALRWLDVSLVHEVWSGGLTYRLAHSKGGVQSWLLSEGLVVVAPRVVGNALGWFNRAAKTTRFTQWTDNRIVLLWSVIADRALLIQTTNFLFLIDCCNNLCQP
ncbi:hypothetical protein ACFE04_000994 [Oxalis oulophora]